MTVRLECITQGYAGRDLFRDFNLDLQPGVVGLLGPNGAGKTTLLRTMATVMPPLAGAVVIDGVPVDGLRAARAARRHIGYLPQDFGFDPGMTVADFVRYAAWMREIPTAGFDAVCADAVAAVDLEGERRTRMRKLSGGMRQRAGIAWAIVGKPSLILLDEPTVGLDPRQRLQFRKIVSRLESSVVLLSTHLIDDIDAICDQVVVINHGQVVFNGSVPEMAKSADETMPGNTILERAYMSLLPTDEQRV